MSKLDYLVEELVKKGKENNLALLEDDIRDEIESTFGSDYTESLFIDVCSRLYDNNIYVEYTISPEDTVVVRSIVGSYLESTRTMTILSKGDVALLVNKARNGDDEARDMLVKRNIRLVVSIAGRYKGFGLDLEDLVQAGFIGLLIAIEKFDANLGYAFSTYASHWIRQKVFEEIGNTGRLIRIPRARFIDYLKLSKYIDRYSIDNGDNPSIDEMVEYMGKSKDYVKDLLGIPDTHLILDKPVLVNGDEKDMSILDVIEDNRSGSVEDIVIRGRLSSDIDNWLSSVLEPREADIIRMRFGLDGTGTCKSLKACAECLDITGERVRQLEFKAKNKLRKSTLGKHKDILEYVKI